jgi:hypothetical protein
MELNTLFPGIIAGGGYLSLILSLSLSLEFSGRMRVRSKTCSVIPNIHAFLLRDRPTRNTDGGDSDSAQNDGSDE